MPKQVTYDAFEFDELSDKAKKVALAWALEHLSWDEWDTEELTGTFQLFLRQRGLIDGGEVYWNLSFCQGDGVAFSGVFNLEALLELKDNGELPTSLAVDDQDKMLVASLRDLVDKLKAANVYGDVRISVTDTGTRYHHYNTMDVEYDCSYAVGDDDDSDIEQTVIEIRDDLVAATKRWSRRLEHYGHDAILAQIEDDYLRGRILDNGYLFTADGKRTCVLGTTEDV